MVQELVEGIGVERDFENRFFGGPRAGCAEREQGQALEEVSAVDHLGHASFIITWTGRGRVLQWLHGAQAWLPLSWPADRLHGAAEGIRTARDACGAGHARRYRVRERICGRGGPAPGPPLRESPGSAE